MSKYLLPFFVLVLASEISATVVYEDAADGATVDLPTDVTLGQGVTPPPLTDSSFIRFGGGTGTGTLTGVGDISSTFNGTLTYTGISASSIDVSNFTGSLTINNSLELFTESSAADELVDLGAIAYGYGGELTGDLSDRLTTTAFGGETTSTGGSAADANSSAVALGVNASVDGALNYEVNTTTGNEVVVTATGGGFECG